MKLKKVVINYYRRLNKSTRKRNSEIEDVKSIDV